MGETAGDTDDLAASALSFRVVVAKPDKKGWSIKRGPYQSWVFAAFDAGQTVGILQGRGVPTDWIRTEWFVGEDLLEVQGQRLN